MASIFLVGCPACAQNFQHFWCTLTCSPDQAAFTNVTAVQRAADTHATAVAAIDVFVGAAFGERFYNSCKVRLGASPSCCYRCCALSPDCEGL